MDILTPANVWASAEPIAVMPLPQRIAMLVTIIGPPTGFAIGGAILWGRGTIGWPEIMTMFLMSLRHRLRRDNRLPPSSHAPVV